MNDKVTKPTLNWYQYTTNRFLLQILVVLLIVNAFYFFVNRVGGSSSMRAISIWEGLVFIVNTVLPLMVFGVAWGQYRRWRKLEALKQTMLNKPQPKPTEGQSPQDSQPDNDKKDKETEEDEPPIVASFLVLIGQWLVLFFCVILLAFGLSLLLMQWSSEQRYGSLLVLTIGLIVLAIIWTEQLKLVRTEIRKLGKNDKNGSQNQPKTQQKDDNELPEWVRQLPLKHVEKVEDYVYIKDKEKEKILDEFRENHGKASQVDDIKNAEIRLERDIQFLQRHLIDKFRQRDYDAKYNQTRYRQYQIAYMVLAALAGIFGSLLALNLNQIENRGWVLLFGFLETLVALGTAYLATITGRESPLQEWLTNRQKAEALRREYQRYIVNLEPYKNLNEIRRQRTLKMRVAAINLLGTPDANEEEIAKALQKAGEKTEPPPINGEQPPPSQPPVTEEPIVPPVNPNEGGGS